MRKTWFHGLAITLGVTTIPNFALAQYSSGDSAGLAASSFNARALSPPPANNSAVRSYMAPQQGQTSFAGYAQNAPVGSGIPGGHVHVPGPGTENSVLNTQYQSVPSNAGPAPNSYEQLQPTYSAPVQSNADSCPACNAGNCATHGVVAGGSQMVQTGPMLQSGGSYGYGAAESCYSQPAISCAPAIVSPSPWIFGANALIFNRFDDDYVKLTTNTEDGANPAPAPNPYAQSFLSTSDAKMQATGGVQFNVGRYFGCGRYAIMGTYWGIFSNPQTATISASDQINGNLRSNLPFALRGPTGAWQYGIEVAGQSVYDLYDNAYAHRLVRDQEFHSAELNFFSFALGGGARQAYAATGGCHDGRRVGFGSGAVHSLGGGHGGQGAGNCGDPCQSAPVACSGPTGPCAPWYGAQCSKLRLNMYGGFRWFRFRDSLEYSSSETDAVFDNDADDFNYRNNVTNDLVGFQLGSLATWCTGTRFNLFGGGNFGIYGNYIDASTFAGTATNTATILSPNAAFNGRAYDYNSSDSDVAYLAEGTFGTGIRISRGWTANVAYRLVGVSGVATAVGQIPRDFANGDEITRIHNNNSLLLHGVSLGASYNF